jgi:hypothetical protein
LSIRRISGTVNPMTGTRRDGSDEEKLVAERRDNDVVCTRCAGRPTGLPTRPAKPCSVKAWSHLRTIRRQQPSRVVIAGTDQPSAESRIMRAREAIGAGTVRCRCCSRPRSVAVRERMYNMLSFYHHFRHPFFLSAVVVLTDHSNGSSQWCILSECTRSAHTLTPSTSTRSCCGPRRTGLGL